MSVREGPWRLSCPECGSRQVTKRNGKPCGRTKRDDAMRWSHSPYEPQNPFYCPQCNTSLKHVMDVKTGEQVTA